jgi:hypothetical protein
MKLHENEGVERMTGYRVCLDCDRKIASHGDDEHMIEDEVFIGCEGYHHRDGEGQAVQLGITASKVTWIATRINEKYYEDCHGEASEDYSDAFSYIGELFDYVSREMLYTVYKDDKPGADGFDIVADMRQKLLVAELTAEAAISGLVPFGIDIEDWK